MKHIITILSIAVVSMITGCSKNNAGQLHRVRFMHFLTGNALPGQKIIINRIIREPLSPPFQYYGSEVTDKQGELSFNADGEFLYAVVSDTMRGPLTSVQTGSQGVMTNGIQTCELYPVTKLRFTHSAGQYLSGEVGGVLIDTTRHYTDLPSEVAVFNPSTIDKTEVTLVTHRPNTVTAYLFSQDGSMKSYQQTITPLDFTPLTMNIPY